MSAAPATLQHSLQEPLKLKFPIILGVLSLISLLAFGLRTGSGQHTLFKVAQSTDLAKIPDISVPSRAGAVFLSILCLAIAAVVTSYVLRRRPVPVFWYVIFGLAWVFAFLCNAVADKSIPLTGVVQTGLLFSVPLIFGSLSGVLCERSGVVNIAIEGQLLLGAFGASVVASATKNAYLGMLAAPIFGLLIGALLALFTIRFAVNQIIVGVVLNVLASGLTAFLFASVLKDNASTLNAPIRLEAVAIPGLSAIPLLGPVLFNQPVLIYIMYVIVAVVTVFLFKSRWGLRLRAVGEHPMAADTMGINVNRTRFRSVMLGSAVAGLGGAILTIGNGVAFADDISAGKGYIALAAMILGRWSPLGAVAAAILFGMTDSLQYQIGILNTVPDSSGHVHPSIPVQFMLMLPYVVTIAAVAGLVGKVRGPASAGEPYQKN